MSEPIWAPSTEVVERANVTRLLRRHGLGSYRELLARSQREPEWFWPAAIDDLGLIFDAPWSEVCDQTHGPEWATWFNGATLNIASNCVHRHAERSPDRLAAVFRGEDGCRRELDFAQLASEVTRLAEALVSLGVQAGDRVAAYLPMSPEAAIASHACAHIGAVHVPIFSGFAASAVAERLVHAGARVVISADGTFRRGRKIDLKAAVDAAVLDAPTVDHVVVWRRLGDEVPLTRERDIAWDEIVADMPGVLEPVPVDAEHPYLLAYTSGTTGRPKGAVHATAGFLVKIAAEMAYEADAREEDRILFATDMGWIMGPWTVVGAGALGMAVVFAEGAPDFPGPDRLWQTIEEERVSILGLSPTLVRSLMGHGTEPVRAHDRSSLQTFVTTGEPWNPAPYRWLFDEGGESRVPIINISGGTEVGACFLSCVHVEPIKECSVGFPALGMAVDCVDEHGQPVARGELGELVCRAPWPAMARGFWGEPERYLDTYWRRVPGLWWHGDYASVDTDDYWYLHGRSDDTLNIAGKRVGPAELESAAVANQGVEEAAAIGVPHEIKGEVAWLVCVPGPGVEGSVELRDAIGEGVARELGRAFRPERILFVEALPHTRSQKIVRRAVKAAVLGQDTGDISSVENPESLEAIREALELSARTQPDGHRTSEAATGRPK